MKDPGSYANPINSSFQNFRTTSHPPRDKRRWQAGGTGVIGVYMGVPRQLYLPICRQLVLPIDLLLLAALLGRAGAVAGDVKLQDDGVMDHPVNRRGGGHGVGEDALPLREDQV